MGASSLRVGVLFSGGKDSAYAVWLLQHQGWEIPVLVTVQPKRPESFIFHYPGIESTSLQTKALGIDQVFIREETSGLDELQNTLSLVKRDSGSKVLLREPWRAIIKRPDLTTSATAPACEASTHYGTRSQKQLLTTLSKLVSMQSSPGLRLVDWTSHG